MKNNRKDLQKTFNKWYQEICNQDLDIQMFDEELKQLADEATARFNERMKKN